MSHHGFLLLLNLQLKLLVAFFLQIHEAIYFVVSRHFRFIGFPFKPICLRLEYTLVTTVTRGFVLDCDLGRHSSRLEAVGRNVRNWAYSVDFDELLNDVRALILRGFPQIILSEQLMHQNVLVNLVIVMENTCLSVENQVGLYVVFSDEFLASTFIYSVVTGLDC